jgi:hypothetical protein
MRRVIAALMWPVLALATVGLGPTATATAPSGAYEWHVADQFLKDQVGSPLGAIARAGNGETLTVEGNGSMDVGARTASGGGTVVHKDAAGHVLATGTFEATSLVSFQSFGCGGGGLPDNLCGGIARLNVTITPDFDNSLHFPSVLWIDCTLGNPPPSAVEGVRVNIKDLINFNKSLSEEEGSGFTVFLKQ